MRLLLSIFLGPLLFTNALLAAGLQIAPGSSRDAVKREIVLITADWCSVCGDLKAALKKSGNLEQISAINESGLVTIPIRQFDVGTSEKSKEAKLKFGKYGGIPALVYIENDKISSVYYPGYSVERMQRAVAEARSELKDDPSLSSTSYKAFESTSPVVTILSTGEELEETPLSNAEKMWFYQKVVTDSYGVSPNQIIQLYADGKTRKAEGGVPFPSELHELQISAPSSFAELNSIAVQMAKARTSRQLMVIAGHGRKKGFSLWNSTRAFNATALDSFLDRAKTQTVMINGNCFGGQFAASKKLQCGFFSAPPTEYAMGCQNSMTGADSSDYLTAMARAMGRDLTTGASKSDLNGDGTVTFAEAHWKAFLDGALSELPYTSLDFLADEHFAETDGKGFPGTERISIDELERLAKTYGSPGEIYALKELINRNTRLFKAYFATGIRLEVERTNKNVQPAIRNLRLDPARIRLIARRLVAKERLSHFHSNEQRQKWTSVESCENQSIADFITPAATNPSKTVNTSTVVR